MTRVRIIGPGRAGSSLATALSRAGWEVLPALGRYDDLSAAAAGTDLLLIATPDQAIADVAHAVKPVERTVVAHVSGSAGLDPLASHRRRAVLHPLVALPDAATSSVTALTMVVRLDEAPGQVPAASDGSSPTTVPAASTTSAPTSPSGPPSASASASASADYA